MTDPFPISDGLDWLSSRVNEKPDTVVVLGSGLGALVEAATIQNSFPYTDIPGFPPSTVAGHKGQLVFGRLGKRNILFLQGRLHFYEGYPVRAVTYPIRLAGALGAQQMLVTNAAGGINPSFQPGTLMLIEDHINMAWTSPLAGPLLDGGPRFQDQSEPYDRHWIKEAESKAFECGIAIKKGTYIWTHGPCYETRAEIEFFRRIGADAVGMSTVPEVLQARQLGMRVLGISTITNPAAGMGNTPLSHQEVLDVGKKMQSTLTNLLKQLLEM